MPVRGDNSLFFSTEISNDGLKQGANDAVGIVQNLASTIAGINPFAALALGATTAFATIANQAFKLAREFEQAMKEVETISAATQANFKGISSEVFAISKMSPDAPAQLAKAYYQIVSAGYDGAKGLQLLETASKAATAGVTDTITAADGITTVLNAFKLSAEDAAEVSDGLFQTVKLGKTTFSELSQSLAQVAPLAAASGYSFQEILAATATLTKQGTPTAQAMTQIRSGIEAVTEVMGDGVAESMTLQQAFKAVNEQAGGSQNKLKELTGRVEAMNAIIALTGKNAEGAANDLKALGDSAGAAEDAFKRMAGSNVNEWKILGNRIKATTEDIGNGLLQMSSSLARFFNDALEDSESLKKSYDDQRTELFKLRGALQSVTEGSEEWKELRDQIIDQYPEFNSGIDGEKVSTQQLLAVLDQVNEAYKLRYKFAQRQQDLKQALEKEGDIEINLDEIRDRFRETLAELERVADEKGVKLRINYNDSESEILASVRKQIESVEGAMNTTFNAGDKFNTTVKGWGETYLNSLSAITTRQRSLNSDLEEQSKKVSEITDRNRRLTKEDLKSKAGQLEAIKRINEAMQASDLNQYAGSGVDEINKALEARKKVIEQFRTIDQAKNLDSLKPFLNSELEEIKAYAKKRYRYLNDDFAGSGGKGKDGFSEYLEQKRKEYEDYFTVLKQLGADAANAQFQNLLKEGEDYGQFLQKQLEKTQEYAKQRDIALAADKSGIQLNRPQATGVNSLTAGGIMPLNPISDDFQLSINYIESKISELNEKIRATTSKSEEERLNQELEFWDEKLRIAENGVDTEENIYSNLRRGLEDLNNNQLRDYIKYWKDRLKEAKKGSKEEQEAIDNITSAENRISKNTSDTIRDISGALGDASDMFRKFGDEDLANALNKLQGVAGGVATIAENIGKSMTTGNWLGIASGVISAISSLFTGGNDKGPSKYERSITRLEGAIGRLGAQIEMAFGAEAIKLQEEQLGKYKTKVEEVAAELEKFKLLRDSSPLGFAFIDKIEELKNELDQAKLDYINASEELQENITGSTRDSLTQSIIDGFRDGKRSIEDFAATFEDTMKNALLKTFETQFLVAQMDEFYKEFYEKGKDGEYSETDINLLRGLFNNVIDDSQEKIDALNKLLQDVGFDPFGVDKIEQRQGMSGAIRGITEDQAGVLEGYWNAVRIDTRGILNNSIQMVSMANQQINHLNEIAVNTRYNRYLESIDSRMATIEKGIQEYQAQG